MDLASPRQLEGMEIGPHSVVLSPNTISISGNPLHRQQWMVSNQFSPLNHLGKEGDPWSEEVEEVFSEVQSLSDTEGCDSQTSMSMSVVANADSLRIFESEGLSGADTKVLGNGENDSSPLECVPLAYWVPRVAEEGEIVTSKVEHSKWVSTMMKSFCKMVGFSIVKHEAQCVAFFRLLEQECLEVDQDGCFRRPDKAGQKGLRELRGLFSSINYGSTYSRNRGSSSGLGALGSCQCP